MKKYLLFPVIALLLAGSASAQHFAFDKISKDASKYAAIVDIQLEVSMGTQTTEVESRGLGTIVSADGLVIFDGSAIDNENPFSSMQGLLFDIKPKSIEIALLDGTKFPAEFIGVDRFTKLGFCRIQQEKRRDFDHIAFTSRDDFRVGQWLATYMLLPKFVSPSLATDIGMISSIIKVPEPFVFIVGFNELEMASVLYDTTGAPVGVLGRLDNPTGGSEMPQMTQGQGEGAFPIMGVIGADKLEKLIKEPPKKGKVVRGWLGIYLQALTPDIADFWGLKVPGGIIINEVAKGSPADSAGLKTGDILVGLNGKPIEIGKEENLPIFQKQISEMGPGDKVDFLVLRRKDGTVDTLNLKATLASAPISPNEAPIYKDTNFEFTLRDLVFADYNLYKQNPQQFKGVVVKEVEPGGWASVGDISPGDVIQSIDGQSITTVDDAKNALAKLVEKKPKEVIFFVWHDNKTVFASVKTEW